MELDTAKLDGDNRIDGIENAAREFLRIKHLRELKAATGNFDFDLNWQELEEPELGEAVFTK